MSGVAFDQSGSPRGGMGIDWAAFMNDDRLGLAVGNFANEMTALYVCDQPQVTRVLGPGQPLRPGRSHAAAAEVRPVLLRLRPRRPARPALGQRPSRARDLQGAGERNLRAARAALLELGQAGREAFMCRSGPRTPVPTCSSRSSAAARPTPTSTATATSTSSSRSTTARPGSSATTAATTTTGSASNSPATAKTSNRDAIGAKVELKTGEHGLPPPALPVQELSLVRRTYR